MTSTPDKKDIKALNENSPLSKLNVMGLLFNGQKLYGKVLVLVEGDTDVAVYGYLLGAARFYLYNCGGCKDFVFFISKLNVDHSAECIAIKDADFDRLDGKCKEYDKFKNLFLTDTHDLETMMLCDGGKVNSEMEQKMICEYISVGSTSGLVQRCMNDLKPLSYVRWYNSRYDLGLKLDKIKCGDLYDNNAVALDEWVNRLCKVADNAQKCPATLKEDVAQFKEANSNVDLWQLTNGHDLCGAMASLVRKRQNEQRKQMNQEGQSYSRGNDNDKILFSFIQGAYTRQQFEKTALCKQIEQWCRGIAAAKELDKIET